VEREERRQQERGGFRTKREAEIALAEALGELRRGQHINPSRVSLSDFLEEEWLPAIEVTIRTTTLNSYRMHIDQHIKPTLGHERLQKITGASLNRLYAQLLNDGKADGSGGLSPATVRRVHAVLRRAFKDAVRWNLMQRNPADQADPPKQRAYKKEEMKTWTADELRLFLAHVANDRLYALWLVLATTGMRRGEALGLQWADVDFHTGRVSIRRSLVAVGYKTQISEPKTKRGRRVVALDKGTLAVLRTHRIRQREEKLAAGAGYDDGDRVFASENGSEIHPDRASKMFQAKVKNSSLPRIRLHDLRHTHATLALQVGVHPKVVSERLGHSSITLTLDTYSHAIPAMQEDAAEKVANLFLGR
jgi:integrase